MKILKTIILLLFAYGLFGQAIEPVQLQPSPYKNGILKSITKVYDEWIQDTAYYYQHDTLIAYIDSIYITQDSILCWRINSISYCDTIHFDNEDDIGTDTSGYNLIFRRSNDTIYIKDGQGELFVKLPTATVDTDDQTLSIVNDTLYIEDGNNVSLIPYLDDTDEQKIDTFELYDGNKIRISMQRDGEVYKTLTLPTQIVDSLQYDFVGDSLTLRDGRGVYFPGRIFSYDDYTDYLLIPNARKYDIWYNPYFGVGNHSGLFWCNGDPLYGWSQISSDLWSSNEYQTLTYTASTRVLDLSWQTPDPVLPLFSTTNSNAGLVNGGSGIAAKFLRGDNTWNYVDISNYNELQTIDTFEIFEGNKLKISLDKDETDSKIVELPTYADTQDLSIDSIGRVFIISLTDGGSVKFEDTNTVSDSSKWTRTGYDLYNKHQTDSVGINTTNPARTLDVNGEMRVRDLNTGTARTLIGEIGDGTLQSVEMGIGVGLQNNVLVNTTKDSTIITAGYGIIVTESPPNTYTIKADTSEVATPYDLTLLDGSVTNELQTISTTGEAGNITLSNGGGTLNLNVNDADASPTNEIELPTQTGNNGKFLQTNGSVPSWQPALTSEVDGSTSNELNSSMSWTDATNTVGVVDGGGTKSVVITGFLESEVDGSTSNELNTSFDWNSSTGTVGVTDAGGAKSATIGNFSTSSTAKGFVPGSNSAGNTYFLRADASWAVPTDNNTTYSAGFGLGLNSTTFYNSRYWKNQDTVKTSLSGILKATSGVLSIASAGTDYQAPLTNPVTGTGTTNYIPKFTGTSTIGNSLIYDNGNVGIGLTNPTYPLQLKYNSGNPSLAFNRADGNPVAFIGTDLNNKFYLKATSGSPDFSIEQNIGGTGQKETFFIEGSNGNVGINISAPTGKLDIKGSAAHDLPTYSAEFLLSTGWTSTDWTGDFATGWTHTVGNTTTLLQSKVAVNATKYQIAYTVTGRTAGTFTIAFGGNTSSAISATGAWAPTSSSTASLVITPTTDFDGTIVISIKSITALSTPIVNLLSSDGTARLEMRANTALGNTFVGVQSGGYNTTGNNNSAHGYYSLFSNTTGSKNSAQGMYSLYSNTTGSNNSAQGYASLFSNTTGSKNSAQGYASLYLNTTGSSNTAQGMYSLFSNTTGSNNSAQGYASLYSNTTGSNNSAQGYNAGRYIADGSTGRTTGDYGLYLGYNTKASADGTSNEIAIGYDAIGLGSNTAAYGNSSMTKHVFGAGNVGIGKIPTYKLDVNGDALINTVRVGLGSGNVSTNTVFGVDANGANTSGNGNIAMGYNAAKLNETGSYNVAIGYNANYSAVSKSGTTAIGYNALYNNGIGSNVFQAIQNTAIGYNALYSNTKGSYSIGIGSEALYNNTTGTINTALGYRTLKANTTGNNNLAVGSQALLANTEGALNAAVGFNSLSLNETGSYNMAMGANALRGVLGSYNIGIGNRAGYYETGSNKLYITSLGDATSEADGRTKAIIYGEQNTTTSSQTLSLNAKITLPYVDDSSSDTLLVRSGNVMTKRLVSSLPSTPDSTSIISGYGIFAFESEPNEWVVEADTNEVSTPYDLSLKQDVMSAGFGIGISTNTIYNSRYWKNQDTLKTTLTGLAKLTAGVVTAITDNSSNWNTAYGWGNHASAGYYTLPALTSGSVLFSNGSTITQDNGELFWDNTLKKLGIGTASPNSASKVHIYKSSSGFSANGIYLEQHNSTSGISHTSKLFTENDGSFGRTYLQAASYSANTTYGQLDVLTEGGTNFMSRLGNAVLYSPGVNINAYSLYSYADGLEKIRLNTEGESFLTSGLKIGGLSGSGDRMVVASSTGVLSTQAIPSAGVTSVSGTSPIVSSGGSTPTISITLQKDLVTNSPLSGGVDNILPGADSDVTLSIANAAADGSTKGAASFTANDFNSSSGNISIDYTNGQAASGSTKGFLSSTDWTTFNNKLSSEVDGSTTNELNSAAYWDSSTGTIGVTDAGGTKTTAIGNFSTSTTAKGFVPGANGAGATKYLNGSGTWTTPASTTYTAGDGIDITGNVIGNTGVLGINNETGYITSSISQLYDDVVQTISTAGDTLNIRSSDLTPTGYLYYINNQDYVGVYNGGYGYYEVSFSCNVVKNSGNADATFNIYVNSTQSGSPVLLDCDVTQRQWVHHSAIVFVPNNGSSSKIYVRCDPAANSVDVDNYSISVKKIH